MGVVASVTALRLLIVDCVGWIAGDALIWSFDHMQHARDRYRSLTGARRMHKELLRLYMTTQTLLLAPFCPHYSEHVWAMLGKRTRSRWQRMAEAEDTWMGDKSDLCDGCRRTLREKSSVLSSWSHQRDRSQPPLHATPLLSALVTLCWLRQI